ncbi:DUF3592 domain-containing protein [Nocardia sp. NPDC049707]|uniref:DUF3592 domain-containing protein n=1 Tax=Nocardia sp. NPDC049707 TaxID=3154735 RepID=UPI003446286E
METDTWMAIGFTVLGIFLFVNGIWQLRQVRDRRRHWKRHRSEVIDYVWESSSSSSSIQYWILRWVDEHGVPRTAKNPTGSSGGTLRSFPFPVEILVDPADPERAQIAGGRHSGVAAGIAALVVGLLFIGLGTLLGVVEA